VLKLQRHQMIWIVSVIGGWSLMAAIFTPQHYVLSRGGPNPPEWWQLLLGNFANFWVWAALTPLVLWFGRRFPIEHPRVGRHLLIHVAAGFALTLIHISIVRYTNALMTGRPVGPWFNFLVAYAATGVMVAWGLLAASQALTYFRRYQDRELRLVEAQLQSLKSQLHPHFLFNTLNAIAELVHGDSKRAERTVTQLSDLLRAALSRDGADHVALKEELDFLRNYVAIQQTLLQERLIARWNIDDDTLDAQVPSMLLQPIVENAIQHGIGPVASGGTLEITARREGGTLLLQVVDDGHGLSADATAAGKAGIGLSNTRARLLHMYGDKHRFDIRPRDGGGVVATFEIPLRFEGAGGRLGGSDVPSEEND
jgi:two-component system LytT family sensor kinase